MPSKEKRKTMKHGSSGVIAIPKPYMECYGLKPGSTATVLYDSILLVVPVDQENSPLIGRLLGQPR